jgi:uncharacterized protein (TIGR03084 family)
MHILEGLKIAVDNIDAVIDLIRSSKDTEAAKTGLMAAFDLSARQSQAILDMRLAKLTGLERDALVAEIEALTEHVAQRYRDLPVAELDAWFHGARVAMLEALLALDPSTRVPWYGPDMSVASTLTARIMETWAHGQDVADALDMPHVTTGALRHVAHIGVRTFANSYLARGLEAPAVPVYVELVTPEGETWTWGDAGTRDRVEGDAIEFCLVVTQRRHIGDTALTTVGPVATEWMRIAQAFAGPPGRGRAPRGHESRNILRNS